MITRKQPRQNLLLIIAVVIAAGLMVGCNLGAPQEQPIATPTTGGGVVNPDVGLPTATWTPPVVLQPTATVLADLLPAERLGPITVEGTGHRTTEPVTVKVTVGKSVSSVVCIWVLQGSGQQGTLATPTTAVLDENTNISTYTFTPEAAGTYVVNCTGSATTLNGLRSVSQNGTPFTVEAKG